jgi:hypothetical protein
MILDLRISYLEIEMESLITVELITSNKVANFYLFILDDYISVGPVGA